MTPARKVIQKLPLRLFLTWVALGLAAGCGTRFVYHSVPTEVTVVEHLPAHSVVRGEALQNLAPGRLYEGIVIDSVVQWGIMPMARIGSSTNQCRVAARSNESHQQWRTILCFDRRDLDQFGSVKSGWFDYEFTDNYGRFHVYQWRDARTTYRLDRYWNPVPRWERYHTNGKYLVAD